MTRPSLKRSALALMLASGLFSASAQAADTAAVLNNYANIVHATYADTLQSAQTLQKAVNDFIASPSAAGLEASRSAWLAAREPYGQTEAFRFYGGPIDDAKDIEGRLNAWPLDEAYIDYVKSKPASGIINNPKAPLTIDRLIKLNARGGEANVATGYHAVEFLLWGQDFNPKGPGDRSYTDFVDGQGKNADRRRHYLKLVTDQVVADVQTLADQWAEGKTNYRAKLLKEQPEAALRKVLTGLAVLSSAELSGERMQVALDNQDQEDEHSCFSDNTHRDAVTNAKGIENVWLGRYVRADGSTLQGASLRDLVNAKDAALAEKTSKQIRSSVEAAEAIPAPFDRAIIAGSAGRPKIEATIKSLTAQSNDIVAAAAAVGIAKLTLVQP